VGDAMFMEQPLEVITNVFTTVIGVQHMHITEVYSGSKEVLELQDSLTLLLQKINPSVLGVVINE
jgi:hypothetical protein